jgi:hypothetical protein
VDESQPDEVNENMKPPEPSEKVKRSPSMIVRGERLALPFALSQKHRVIEQVQACKGLSEKAMNTPSHWLNEALIDQKPLRLKRDEVRVEPCHFKIIDH